MGVIEGDGIGPEVIHAALRFLEEIGEFEIVRVNAGYEYFRRTGKPIEDGGMDVLRRMDAVLKGPLTTLPGPETLKSINLMLRHELDLYANVRPFKSFRGISLRDLNFVIVRENTEGLYSGVEGMFKDIALSARFITRAGCERIVKYAFNLAKAEGFRRVTAVHKANILKVGDGLFRQVFFDVARSFPDVESDEVYVDAAAYYIVKEPKRFHIIVTLNLYGDILSDLAAGLIGSLGLCGSALIGDSLAVFEPVHGSAPDIAGRGIANPVGSVLSLSLMLKYLGMKNGDEHMMKASRAIDDSVRNVLEEGKVLTPDLGGSSRTEDMVDRMLAEFRKKL
ncbi:MAG: isocitrate/isopropylmalate dehydrogenase family protein [Thermoproteota archaeon]|nr:MAG: isocitrate/isopropylmalate dehydrogenase family protein [Candidatus Korarchaeota archaeon]